jgi:ribokinase
VLLNPAPAQVLEKDLLELVDVLLPNEYEAALMTGIPLQSAADTRRAAEKLLSLGPKNLIVTLGNQGAMLFNEKINQGMIIPAFQVQTIDTTAAGDCFVGALAVGICEGKSLPVAAEFASAAAAISVTRVGAQPSLPRREEVEQFMQERSKSI